MEREQNTQYVLSLSYGKDSLACLAVIDEFGLPLDRIVHAEVWATQDIPADLPPMIEFKKHADEIIKRRWGIEVEHICAMQKQHRSQTVNVERERESPSPTESVPNDGSATPICSTEEIRVENLSELTKDSHRPSRDGVRSSSMKKLTYEDIFYRPIKNSKSKIRSQKVQVEREIERESTVYGFPMQRGNWCSALKLKQITSKDFLLGRELGVRTDSKGDSSIRLPDQERAIPTSNFRKSPKNEGRR